MYGYAYWVCECHTCGTQYDYGYSEHFCDETCYAASLTKEERIKFLASKMKKEAKANIQRLKQDKRVGEFMANHSPTYEINSEEVVFYIYQHGKKKFLGRWQKDKTFVFGQVRLRERNLTGVWLENLRDFEEIAMRKEGTKFEIRDHLGNEVSFKDFLWYALTSEVNHEKQRTSKREIKKVCESVIGVHQSYTYSRGLKP